MGFTPRQMVQRPRRESTGNRVLLVLVNSLGSYTDTSIVDQTVLVALQHFGFPFRIHDLAAGPITRELLEECAAVVIAQARMGDVLRYRRRNCSPRAWRKTGWAWSISTAN